MDRKLIVLGLVLAALLPYATADHTGVGPVDDLLHSVDEDQDAIPDEVESTLCGASFVRGQINANAALTGVSCPTTLDLDYGERFVPLGDLPTDHDVGPDADNDGVPAYVRVTFTPTSIRVANPPEPQSGTPREETVAKDDDDGDPNKPFQRVFTHRVPVGVEPGDDLDQDGVPATLVIHQADLVIDTRPGAAPPTPLAAPDRVENVDPDDNDKNVPAQRVHQFSAGCRGGLPGAPVGEDPTHTLGPDTDGDGLRDYVRLEGCTYVVDTTNGQSTASSNNALDVTVLVDPEPNDVNQPLPCGDGVVVPVGSVTFTTRDGDGDGVVGAVDLFAEGKRVRVCGDGVFTAETPPGPISTVPGPDSQDGNKCAPVNCPLTAGNDRHVLVLRALDPVNGLDGFASMRANANAGLCAPVAPPCFRFESSLWSMDCEPVPFTTVTYRYRTASTTLGESQIGPVANTDDNVVQFNAPAFFFGGGAAGANVVAYFKATYQTGPATVSGVVDYLSGRLAPLPSAPAPQPDLPCRVGDTFDEADGQGVGVSTPFLVQFA